MRCPVCESGTIVVAVDRHRRAFCMRCGSRWRQQGQRQWSISRFTARSGPAPLKQTVTRSA